MYVHIYIFIYRILKTKTVTVLESGEQKRYFFSHIFLLDDFNILIYNSLMMVQKYPHIFIFDHS